MILKASQRANGQNLAVHLMRVDDNEHVSLHQLRGFASDTLKDAFKAAGTPVETMVVQGEGHGFYKPENRAELYRRMDAFLAKYIGPGAK